MKPRHSGIYRITNLCDGKVIIGQSQNIHDRWRAYRNLLRRNIFDNCHLQNAWNKYGECNFIFEVIKECPVENLDEEEIKQIKEHNSINHDYGYNIDHGGKRQQCSEETKRKISQAHVGKLLSEETKAKMRLNNKGEGNPMFGRKHSDETRKKIGDAGKRKTVSEETKQKISQAMKGRVFSEETKRKIREANKGEKSYLFGKHLSEETKKKISESKTGRTHSEETKQKIRESNTGKHSSDEIRQKLREGWARRKARLQSTKS